MERSVSTAIASLAFLIAVPTHAADIEAKLVIDPLTEAFSFEGELPFEFRAMPNRSCVDYELSISGSATAHVPWEQNPRGGEGGAGPGEE